MPEMPFFIVALVDAKRLPSELRPYLPLYLQVLSEMGAGTILYCIACALVVAFLIWNAFLVHCFAVEGDRDYRALAQEIEMKTGGIDTSKDTHRLTVSCI